MKYQQQLKELTANIEREAREKNEKVKQLQDDLQKNKLDDQVRNVKIIQDQNDKLRAAQQQKERLTEKLSALEEALNTATHESNEAKACLKDKEKLVQKLSLQVQQAEGTDQLLGRLKKLTQHVCS